MPWYIGWNNVTASMVTIRSPFCGYNLAWCVELTGEVSPYYWNKIQPVCLRKLSTWSLIYRKSVLKWQQSNNISNSLPTRWRRKPANIDMERNYVTVTLCICNCNTYPIHAFRPDPTKQSCLCRVWLGGMNGFPRMQDCRRQKIWSLNTVIAIVQFTPPQETLHRTVLSYLAGGMNWA